MILSLIFLIAHASLSSDDGSFSDYSSSEAGSSSSDSYPQICMLCDAEYDGPSDVPQHCQDKLAKHCENDDFFTMETCSYCDSNGFDLTCFSKVGMELGSICEWDDSSSSWSSWSSYEDFSSSSFNLEICELLEAKYAHCGDEVRRELLMMETSDAGDFMAEFQEAMRKLFEDLLANPNGDGINCEPSIAEALIYVSQCEDHDSSSSWDSKDDSWSSFDYTCEGLEDRYPACEDNEPGMGGCDPSSDELDFYFNNCDDDSSGSWSSSSSEDNSGSSWESSNDDSSSSWDSSDGSYSSDSYPEICMECNEEYDGPSDVPQHCQDKLAKHCESDDLFTMQTCSYCDSNGFDSTCFSKVGMELGSICQWEDSGSSWSESSNDESSSSWSMSEESSDYMQSSFESSDFSDDLSESSFESSDFSDEFSESSFDSSDFSESSFESSDFSDDFSESSFESSDFSDDFSESSFDSSDFSESSFESSDFSDEESSSMAEETDVPSLQPTASPSQQPTAGPVTSKAPSSSPIHSIPTEQPTEAEHAIYEFSKATVEDGFDADAKAAEMADATAQEYGVDVSKVQTDHGYLKYGQLTLSAPADKTIEELKDAAKGAIEQQLDGNGEVRITRYEFTILTVAGSDRRNLQQDNNAEIDYTVKWAADVQETIPDLTIDEAQVQTDIQETVGTDVEVVDSTVSEETGFEAVITVDLNEVNDVSSETVQSDLEDLFSDFDVQAVNINHDTNDDANVVEAGTSDSIIAAAVFGGIAVIVLFFVCAMRKYSDNDAKKGEGEFGGNDLEMAESSKATRGGAAAAVAKRDPGTDSTEEGEASTTRGWSLFGGRATE